jgi:hypothetical protein
MLTTTSPRNPVAPYRFPRRRCQRGDSLGAATTTAVGGGHGPQARTALAGRALIAPLSSPARPRVTTDEKTDEGR